MESEREGKIYVVTGANSGIGKATAMGLAKLSATVVMICRDRERGEQVRSEIIARRGVVTTRLRS